MKWLNLSNLLVEYNRAKSHILNFDFLTFFLPSQKPEIKCSSRNRFKVIVDLYYYNRSTTILQYSLDFRYCPRYFLRYTAFTRVPLLQCLKRNLLHKSSAWITV